MLSMQLYVSVKLLISDRTSIYILVCNKLLKIKLFRQNASTKNLYHIYQYFLENNEMSKQSKKIFSLGNEKCYTNYCEEISEEGAMEN